jgi:hypothetical protein
MIHSRPRRLALIPAEYSGHARIVGCPWCHAELMLVLDEDGRGTPPLDVQDWDLAEGKVPGCCTTKGGWVLANPHRCRPATRVYTRSDRNAR